MSRLLRRSALRLRSIFLRARHERELDVELRFHFDMLAAHYRQSGMGARAARRAALQTFGAVDGIKDDVRDTWLSRAIERACDDVRYGVRTLAAAPAFALGLILTIALAVGVNTSVFGIAHSILVRPLPFQDPARLAVLRHGDPAAGLVSSFSLLELADYGRVPGVRAIAELHTMWFILLSPSRADGDAPMSRAPERVSTAVVSPNYFEVLGVRPIAGRSLRETDDRDGAPGVLVLSHAYWQRAFGGDARVVGRTFRFNDRPHTVIGVLPPVPLYPEENAVYMPVSHCPFHSNPDMLSSRTARMKAAFARMKPGVTLEQAQAELDAIRGRLQAAYPEAYRDLSGYRVVATPLLTELTHDFHSTVVMLVATAALVLLIVCASVANLLLARLLRRERELAVRTAIGAGRLRLTCQLLTESLVLTTGGALLGLAVAAGSLTLLRTLAARFTPRAQEVSIDGTVLLFTLGLAVLTGLIFGALPAFQNSRSVLPSLSETGGGATGNPGRVRLRNSLVVAQVAVSMALLAGAGAVVRSFVNLTRVDPGFRAEQVATWSIDLNFTKYRSAGRRRDFYRRFLQELCGRSADRRRRRRRDHAAQRRRQRHGRRAASGMLTTPPGEPLPRVRFEVAQPRLLQGRRHPAGRRTLLRGDRRASGRRRPSSSIRRWPRTTGDARIPSVSVLQIEGGDRWLTVVGVVGNARQRLDSEPTDEVYLPLFQQPYFGAGFAARTTLSLPESRRSRARHGRTDRSGAAGRYLRHAESFRARSRRRDARRC